MLHKLADQHDAALVAAMAEQALDDADIITEMIDAGIMPIAEKKYRIVSRAILPVRFGGLHSFSDAYHMCCDWNSWHLPEDLAVAEVEDGACFLEDL